MSNTNTGGPAFPVPNDANVNNQEGMTLRDYFATAALQAYLSGPDRDSFTHDEWAVPAYQMADAMLKAREV